MYILHLDGVDIAVTRKAIRSLRLRICPPSAVVRLSVPWQATREDAWRFIQSRREWILRHRERMLSAAPPAPEPPVPLTDGSRVCLWGREYVLRLERGRSGLTLTDDSLRLRLPYPANPVSPVDTAHCARALERECRKLLLARLTELAAFWCPVLGVRPPELRIRNMKTRWGSCNPRAGRVWINAELARRSPECLEYVLVHELAHLLERGHTSRFWAILDRRLPDWRRRRGLLDGRLRPEPAR